MKNKLTYIIYFLTLLACSCNFDNNVDYTLAKKLEGKTFISYSDDIKENSYIVFNNIDKSKNIIDVLIDNTSYQYNIKTNKLNNYELSNISLDVDRWFDEEFYYNEKKYENCSLEWKYAKLLENSEFRWYYDKQTEPSLYTSIIFENINLYDNTINYYEGQSYLETQIYKIDTRKSNLSYKEYQMTFLNNDTILYGLGDDKIKTRVK